jgi:hypothetical protein
VQNLIIYVYIDENICILPDCEKSVYVQDWSFHRSTIWSITDGSIDMLMESGEESQKRYAFRGGFRGGIRSPPPPFRPIYRPSNVSKTQDLRPKIRELFAGGWGRFLERTPLFEISGSATGFVYSLPLLVYEFVSICNNRYMYIKLFCESNLSLVLPSAGET